MGKGLLGMLSVSNKEPDSKSDSSAQCFGCSWALLSGGHGSFKIEQIMKSVYTT